MTPHFIDGMSELVYHSDPIDANIPSLSASIATKIVRDSPYHAYLAHPRLGNHREPPSREMEMGTLLHAAILGQPLNVQVIDAKDYRTKAAQYDRDLARDEGRIPLLAREQGDLVETVEALRKELLYKGIELEGQFERVVAWEEQTLRGPVLCRGRLDCPMLDRPAPVIYDIKSCHSAHPEAIRQHVVGYGYDTQRAAYMSAVEKIRPELAGRVEYLWIFFEVMPAGSPRRVLVTVAEAAGSMRELGERKWQNACEIWADCLATDRWPAYSESTVRVEARHWELEGSL